MNTISIIKGDGIGPEIMNATLRILDAAGAQLQTEELLIGKSVYESGNTSGIDNTAWDSIRKTKVILKAPVTTPQGSGYKSINVSIRKTLGLFANIRPCISLHPFVTTKHPQLDIVIIRENEEDLYAGIEHQQTDEVIQCLKLISRPGCEKIIRYAFEFAKQQGRKKVSCFTKDNIMKQTDGLFHKIFNEIASEYADIDTDHWIIDIGAARVADTPELFDVIVLPNLYGDILSDIVAQLTGSVGLAGSANIGEHCALFEAIHGSAPDIASQNIANPSGLLQAAILMLHHLSKTNIADTIQNAWLKTIEDGIHTKDIFKEGVSKQCVTTSEFCDAIIKRLGQTPAILQGVNNKSTYQIKLPVYQRKTKAEKDLAGVDVFLHWDGAQANQIADSLLPLLPSEFLLQVITNRGVKVWPSGFPETFCTDHWRCRFVSKENNKIGFTNVLHLLTKIHDVGYEIIKTEHLYNLNHKPAYSLAQGQ